MKHYLQDRCFSLRRVGFHGKRECLSHSPLLLPYFYSLWFRLTLSILHVATLNVDIPCALDVSFFPLNRVRDLLGILHLAFAKRNLFPDHRLFLDRHLLLTHGNAVGLPLADGLIRGLARTRAALYVDFFAGDWHIKRLLLSSHLFTDAHLTRLYWLLTGSKLFFTQLDAVSTLCIGLVLGASGRPIPSCLGRASAGGLPSVA